MISHDTFDKRNVRDVSDVGGAGISCDMRDAGDASNTGTWKTRVRRATRETGEARTSAMMGLHLKDRPHLPDKHRNLPKRQKAYEIERLKMRGHREQ